MATGGMTEDMDILSCPVCFENFDSNTHKPKMFPCQHTICQSCVLALIRASRETTIGCPSCRAKIPIPPKKANGFPNNLTLVSIMSPKPREKCRDHVESTVQNVICMTCCRFLCHLCMLSQEHASHQVKEAAEAFRLCIADTNKYNDEFHDMQQVHMPANFHENKESITKMIATVQKHASSLVAEVKSWESSNVSRLQQQLREMGTQYANSISPSINHSQQSSVILQKAAKRDVSCIDDMKHLKHRLDSMKQRISLAKMVQFKQFRMSTEPQLTLPKLEETTLTTGKR